MDTPNGGGLTPEERSLVPAGAGGGYVPPPPPPADEEDEEDEGMLRMSFLEHLEEMRSRIIRALMGFGVAFLVCIVFCYPLWNFVRAPAVDALTKIGVNPPNLVINEPMEGFSIIWVKVPLVFALFLASPWVLYQVWAFIAPGLYQKEKRLAFPFVLSTAGLFILGGCFAYFVAFRYGLAFLLSIGLSNGVTPLVTITHYFDLFVNVMLGVALVFELPVAIFFLTLLHLASPRFLMAHSRYAILAIVIIAAIITPTPDFFNLMLFAVPMCALFFIGVFAAYLLVLKREGRKFPWPKVMGITLLVMLLLAGIAHAVLVRLLHYHLASHWPFYLK
ncbi:MAG: twin-arginine translocase subunit TatC [Acidobacteriota bacterium]|nr:twin-arginine translocase subunit TatC [Acidobacteriota bacterium]